MDRAAILEAVLPALRDDLQAEPLPGVDLPEAATGLARIVARTGGVLAGVPVAAEAFARLGARLRPIREEGSPMSPGDPVAEVGGPVRAILAAERTALGFLGRLSSVASSVASGTGPGGPHPAQGPDGATGPEPPLDPLTAYAVEVGLSARGAVSENPGDVSFELEELD